MKFNKKELEIVGYSNSFVKVPCFKTPITPRENYLRALRHENPLWVPINSDVLYLCPSIIPDVVARAFVMEEQPYTGPVGGKDMFGVEWEFVPTVGGSMVKPGKPMLADIEDWKEVIHFPNLDDWDWEGSAKANAEMLKTDKFIQVWVFTGFFERLISFMDFENAAVALIDEDQQEYVHELFQKLADLYKDMVHRFRKYYHADCLYFHDDWGSQRAPFFSLNVAREMIVPYIKQVVDCCHEEGMMFELHSCGKNDLVAEAYAEAGVDLWAGQPMVDKLAMIDKIGDRVAIGIESDAATPFGGVNPHSMEERRTMYREWLNKYASRMNTRPVYLQNLASDPEEAAIFYEEGRKFLCGEE